MPGWSRCLWAWTRPAVGVAILGVLVWWLGADPFLDALGRIDAWSLAAAGGIAVVTTVCCAWRWRLVSRGLGSDLPLGAAVTAYYRSQFLNTVLPGGVVGDVHRAVRRGRDVGSLGHGVRSVVWERTVGQVVQIVLTVGVLLVLPSPVRSTMPVLAVAVVAAALCVVLGVVLLGRLPGGLAGRLPGWLPGWAQARRGPTAALRLARCLASDLRAGLLARRAWPGVVLASCVVVAGHTATFMVAARTAGSTASSARLLPLALLVLLAMALPTHIAGWGPREGVAAWAFAAAGLGPAEGVAAAAVFGVIVLVATLPGAAVLVAGWLRPSLQPPAGPVLEGGAHG